MLQEMQNAPREHSAIILTSIKLPFVFKTFVLSVFEWPLKTGFTVFKNLYFASGLLGGLVDGFFPLCYEYIVISVSGECFLML